MKRTASLILFLIVTFLSSCKEIEKRQEELPVEETENQTSNEDKVSDFKKSNTQKIITENSFMGFKTGDKINLESENLEKSTQENGEGSFFGYNLLNENGEKIGFIFPKYNNKEIIDIIEINSSEYKTKEGIGIGSTYQDLKKIYPNIETHGSEIESRTSSNIGSLYFTLDVGFNTYEIDESKIKPTTKIIRISLRDIEN